MDMVNKNPLIDPKHSVSNESTLEPASFVVIQSLASKLMFNKARNEVPIELNAPKFNILQGMRAVIFNKDDYMVKLAASCRYTLIGKFTNTMPKLEVIRTSFILQTQLSWGVKIAQY